MASTDPDRRRGDDWSLRALYDLVPDAYEVDLLEESRRPPVQPPRFDAVRDESEADDGPAPSVTQAQFLVERLLGGVVVDDQPR